MEQERPTGGAFLVQPEPGSWRTLHGSARCPDGTLLAFQVLGPASAPPLLLLAGAGTDHSWWREVRPSLSAEFLTITFDYRGTGTSVTDEAHPKPWSTSLFADDAASVLDALAIGDAHVYGASLGGRVAQMLAVEHPERLRALVLACTSPGGDQAVERSHLVRRRLAVSDAQERREVWEDLMYTPAHGAWRRSVGRACSLLPGESVSMTALRRHARAGLGHDAYERLATIDGPVLVLHGTDDLVVPAENAHLIRGKIPQATLSITAGGRHGFFEEFPMVTREVISFLST